MALLYPGIWVCIVMLIFARHVTTNALSILTKSLQVLYSSAEASMLWKAIWLYLLVNFNKNVVTFTVTVLWSLREDHRELVQESAGLHLRRLHAWPRGHRPLLSVPAALPVLHRLWEVLRVVPRTLRGHPAVRGGKKWRLRPKFSVQPTQRVVALGHDGGTGPGQAESQAGQAEHPRNVQVSRQSIISKIFPAPNLHLKNFFWYYVKKILRYMNHSLILSAKKLFSHIVSLRQSQLIQSVWPTDHSMCARFLVTLPSLQVTLKVKFPLY